MCIHVVRLTQESASRRVPVHHSSLHCKARCVLNREERNGEGVHYLGLQRENAGSELKKAVAEPSSACAQVSACGRSIEVPGGPHSLVAVSSLLKRVCKAKNASFGQRVHQHIIECGYGWESLLGNCLMHMYGKCGLVEEAQATFDRLPNQDSYSWNILISLYGHNRGTDHAKRFFDLMPNPNVVTWNALLSLLIMNGQHKEALDAFTLMQLRSQLPNDVTFVCMLDACCAIVILDKGRQAHTMIIDAGYEESVVVGTALVNMYAKCACLCFARNVFRRLGEQDVVSCTAMIGGLAQNSCNEEALECFRHMRMQGVSPNDITFMCVLEACANLVALTEGSQIHSLVLLVGYENETKVGTALIDMYSKCGSLESAADVFGCVHQRTLVSWNAMITAFGLHGFGTDAVALFSKMRAEYLKPDVITFIAVMNACSHVGLVNDGLKIFLCMNNDYGLEYEIDHYVCVIDLLGRSGRMDEAEEVVLNIPLGDTVVAWLCLLSACKIHGDTERGFSAASRCFKMDQCHAAPYVMLSNMYMELVFSELQSLGEAL